MVACIFPMGITMQDHYEVLDLHDVDRPNVTSSLGQTAVQSSHYAWSKCVCAHPDGMATRYAQPWPQSTWGTSGTFGLMPQQTAES